MTTLVGKIFSGYNFLFDELGDSRTKTWPLVGRPYIGIGILVLYLLFVMKWGPKWMQKRKPFNLERTLIVYNMIQAVYCVYFWTAAAKIWIYDYKFICEPVDTSNSETALIVANLVYYYYLLKIVDLFDTVFFVLRKKFNQVTFLHVYHHTGMVLLAWGATMYLPGGHGTLIGVVNTFVHGIMYTYYLLTVAYPSVKGSLWWKKYITQLQILQFLINTIHMGSIIFIPNCAFPRWTAAVFLPQNIFMLILFIDFYIKAYIKKPKVKSEILKVTEEELHKNSENQRCVEIRRHKENINSRL